MINKFLYAGVIVCGLASCAQDFDRSYAIQKPAEVTAAEELNAYGTLLKYVDPSFRLGNTLTTATFQEEGTATTLTTTNFNELTLTDAFLHRVLVSNEGDIDTTAVSRICQFASEKGIGLFGTALCGSGDLNETWLNSLIAPVFVELDEISGADTWDFEAEALGTTFPLKKSAGDEGKGNAVIEDDPDGQSGHVVHVSKTNQSFPAFTLTFPEGRKLGDYKKLVIDYYAMNNTAVNQALVMNLAGKPVEFKKPSEYGCSLKNWGRGLIEINLEAMNFDETLQALTTVELIIGPKLLNCEYLIDNIQLQYTYKPSYYEEKTPEEKASILTAEIERYSQAVVSYGKGMNAWVVADRPVTAAGGFWKTYLGDAYLTTAARSARAANSSAKLFVTEQQLTDAGVRASLKDLLAKADGIDGIDVQLSLDANNPQDLNTMFSELAATGKLIRLNIQSIAAPTETAAAALLANAIASYKTVSQAQRYGVSFAAVNESATNVGLWTSGYNRKQTYASLVNALQ